MPQKHGQYEVTTHSVKWQSYTKLAQSGTQWTSEVLRNNHTWHISLVNQYDCSMMLTQCSATMPHTHHFGALWLLICGALEEHLLTHSHTHKYFMALFWDYPNEPVPEEIFFWTLWWKGRYQRQTHRQSGWTHLHHPPFLRQMPFLPQPSQFILAWDRHQICWLAYPVAWFAV